MNHSSSAAQAGVEIATTLGEPGTLASAAAIFEELPPEATFYFAQNLAVARKMNNRKATQVLKDIAAISWKKKRYFNPHYYFKFQMYEFAAERPHSMLLYVDNTETKECNRQLNHALARENSLGNKLQMESIVSRMALRVTETQHVFMNQPMPFEMYSCEVKGGVEFLRNRARYPLFCKPNKSSQSIGIFLADQYNRENDTVRIRGTGDVLVEELVDEIFSRFGENGFIAQSRLIQHPALSEISGEGIGCVRVVTVKSDGEIIPVYGVWKVPSVNAIADNFWRCGSVVAAIDNQSGKIIRAQIDSGIMGAEVQEHPVSGAPLTGFEIPQWNDVKSLATSAASLFQGANIVGWDIAITKDGPCIVEGNTNPDHSLYQLAFGRGLYDDDAVRVISDMSYAAKKEKKNILKQRKQEARSEKSAVVKRISTQGMRTQKQ